MATSLVLTVVLASFVTACTALQWSSGLKQDAAVYACAGGTLTLPWNVSTQTGDSILNMQWFQHAQSTQMIAVEANGNFLPIPAFSARVHRTTNAGLEIDHVTVTDAGTYWVEVLWQGAGETDVHTLNSTVTVFVTDGLQTTDGQLHADLSPVAQYSNVTEEYHVVLRCGTFTYPTYPPYEVIWVTPSGLARPSSGYKNGSFYFLIPNPVEGGSYICRIPPAEACMKGSPGEVTVTVDKMEARLAVMEARQADLENKDADLEKRTTDLEKKNADLEKRNAALEAESKERVSFHARLSRTQTVSADSAIILSNIVTNQGNAYSSSTGRFTAPLDGTYCLLATAETGDKTAYIGMSLMVGATEVNYVSVHSDEHVGPASVHSVVHLRAGQNVWLKNFPQESEFWFRATAFSGFLVSPDSK